MLISNRLKKSVFQLGGLKTKYLRFYSVLPNMKKRDFEKHMQKVRKFARSIKWKKFQTNTKYFLCVATKDSPEHAAIEWE